MCFSELCILNFQGDVMDMFTALIHQMKLGVSAMKTSLHATALHRKHVHRQMDV